MPESKQIKLRGDDGATVTLELPRNVRSGPHSKAIDKLFQSGGPKGLSQEEWESIRDLRAHVKGDIGETALIVRFDWRWVRIDEKALDWNEAIDY